jgi:hypothetical protein
MWLFVATSSPAGAMQRPFVDALARALKAEKGAWIAEAT